jgi:cation transport ATPase
VEQSPERQGSSSRLRALCAFVVVALSSSWPLILAAPIALMSGLSRAARAGIVVKGAGTFERLGRAARTVLLGKTGTITASRPRPRP